MAKPVLPVVAVPDRDGVYGRVRDGFARRRVYSPHGVRSRTKQEFAAECDINNIMKRYEKDGLVAHVNKYQGQYGEFVGAPEYHEAMNKVIAADEMFMTLPAKVREKFANDAGRFLGFVESASREELAELGLLNTKSDNTKNVVPADAGGAGAPDKSAPADKK